MVGGEIITQILHFLISSVCFKRYSSELDVSGAVQTCMYQDFVSEDLYRKHFFNILTTTLLKFIIAIVRLFRVERALL